MSNLEQNCIPPASSGEPSKHQSSEFPELIDAVAQATLAVSAKQPAQPPGTSLYHALRNAIAQFPERVKGAIAYLNYQQQKQQIENPAGYLYEAIVEGWTLAAASNSTLPDGLNLCFERMKKQGLVVAAMAINGVSHVARSARVAAYSTTYAAVAINATSERSLSC